MTDNRQPYPIGRKTDCSSHLPVIFDGVSSDVLDELNSLCRIRNFAIGQTVIGDHEAAEFVGYIVSGILRMQKSLPDGRQHIVGLLVENEMFGRVFDGPSHFAIEAATDVTLCTFPRRDFEALITRRAELEHLMLTSVLDELDAAREWIMLLGCRRVIERFSAFLLILCRRWLNVGVVSEEAGVPEVHIPVSRADIAQYLGTRVETISRAVQALSKADIIRIKDPYRFEIVDMTGLIEMSGNRDFAELDWMGKLQPQAAGRRQG
ncbi:MAG: Crp/Fnr family transcriptional regulator [Paracoccaceae bacterium]